MVCDVMYGVTLKGTENPLGVRPFVVVLLDVALILVRHPKCNLNTQRLPV